ncbi:hypothetical protein [Streptomyces sp. HNM1019]|uniref:hypothetical protein n=1 Tax=Streptomyces sp. HNM1019 TaxID=3424717 RepID=UPI003D76FD13
MVYGGRTNRPAVCGGPCVAAVLLLLAATLLHTVLALGVVRASPPTGPERCVTGKAGAAGVPDRAPAPSAPGDAGAPVPAPPLSASAPVGAPAPVTPLPLAPETEDERSTSSASAAFSASARDGAGHPDRHAGRVARSASFGGHRSLSTSVGPLALIAVRGRPAQPAPGAAAFGTGDGVPAGRLSSRSVVLRC